MDESMDGWIVVVVAAGALYFQCFLCPLFYHKIIGITATACTSLGNVITILFTQDFNDVPLVQLDASKLVHSRY